MHSKQITVRVTASQPYARAFGQASSPTWFSSENLFGRGGGSDGKGVCHPEFGATVTFLFPRPRSSALYTAAFVDDEVSGISHLFYATVARDEDEARAQLRHRIGGRLAYMVTIEEGFDPSEPVTMSLLSDAMVDLLEQIQGSPSSALSAGFSLLIEHRFSD